ncbi:right-handed parallel beta-helix repeat-containing protein [Sphingobacterium sp. Ag1]|uniref:right-handed parallel beta-helix repeat-containing protein n=1 Tax=Sphingobacterium sp. Ag1 TaxID=1643451 RepID=UPI000A988405|nr:right-handed parallel beta-helix repeat-containing protein [Sphingobacterium sp. Ag1]
MKLLNIFFISALFLLAQDLKGQDFSLANVSKTKAEIEKLQNNAFDLTTLLPKGYVVNGTVDYTDIIQKGLNKYKSVKMPNFPVLINFKGLTINSNSDVFFQKQSSLIMLPNDRSTYAILDIQRKENVKIYNANLIGDRFQHKGKIGEWGMGIRIVESRNVVFYNPNVRNTWGDGIYLGDDNVNSVHNENIFILNCSIISSRRNGISIISGENVFIQDGKISKSDGTMPKAGLDIEPNNGSDVINNIFVNNLETSNEGAGVMILLNKLVGRAGKVNISLNGHSDNGGSMGLYISNLETSARRLVGTISIKNSNYINNKTNGIFIENYASINTPKLTISDSKIKNSNSSNNKSPRWGAGISFGRDSRKAIFNKMGNVQIKNIAIVDNRQYPLMRAGLSFDDDNGSNFENVNVEGIEVQGIKTSDQFYLKAGVNLKR